MSWIGLISAVASFLGKLFSFLEKKFLVNLGAKGQRADDSEKALDDIKRRDAVVRGLTPDERKRLRDKYKRGS